MDQFIIKHTKKINDNLLLNIFTNDTIELRLIDNVNNRVVSTVYLTKNELNIITKEITNANS